MLTIFWLALILIVVGLVYMRQIVDFIRRRKRLIDLVDKIPGPHAIPLLGCVYQFKWNSLGKDLKYQPELPYHPFKLLKCSYQFN